MKLLEKMLMDKLFFNEKPKRERKRDITFKDMIRFEEELEKFKQWQKEQEKKHKKEPPKSAFDFGKLAMLLVASFPIIGPLYLLWIMSLLQDLAKKVPLH